MNSGALIVDSPVSELLLDGGVGRLWTKAAGDIQPVPLALRQRFAPATHCLFEWIDYWLEYPGANRLRVGDEWLEPVNHDLFQVRFENQLGLTLIRPYHDQEALCPPLTVEIISRKFPTPASHLKFFSVMLHDLFVRAARIPFETSAPTSRGVTEALQPPTPLFVLHFLTQQAFAVRAALAIIQAAPHRQLKDYSSFVALADASESDADVLISILHAPEEWVRASGLAVAERLRGYAPARVWQRQSEDTFKTPENRFVLFFIRELLTAAESLPGQSWWKDVSADRRRVITDVSGLLRQAVHLPMFNDLKAMQQVPTASRVLMRREGYRELFLLWQSFQRARRPLFEHLRHAIDVRNVAKLYELWAFFALVEEISLIVEESPVLDLPLSDESGLGRRAEARFGAQGSLIYDWEQQTYSVPLRPDFTWMKNGRADVVLDAKFRLKRRWMESVDEEMSGATARQSDLYKMHTYRDALGVRAAVSIYPGDASIFYHRAQGQQKEYTLRQLLKSDDAGIGAIAMQPC